MRKRIKGIEPYELDDVIAALRQAIAKSEAIQCYKPDGSPLHGEPNDDTIQVCLEDIRENQTSSGKLHSYTLRFSYLNPMAADRGKRDLKTKTRTFLPIEKGEVGEVGAHLVIALTDTSGSHAGLSRCALEQMPSLSRSKILSLVGTVAEQFMAPAARPEFEYSEGKGKKRRILRDTTRLKLSSYPEKSETLEEDLERGVLKKIRFLGHPKETDNLSLDGLEKLEQEISASVKETFRTGAKAKSLISAARKHAKALGMRAQVDIEKEDAGGTRHKTRELDLDKEGLADQLFTRQEPITSTRGFPECYEAINDETVALLVQLIDREDCWS